MYGQKSLGLKIVGQMVFGQNDIGRNVIGRNVFGRIVLHPIEMMRNENRLFGHHFETEQHFQIFFAEL